MEGVRVDGGCKNFAAENSVVSPFYTKNNNEHVVQMHSCDWLRKMGKDKCKTRTKKTNRPRVEIGYRKMKNLKNTEHVT